MLLLQMLHVYTRGISKNSTRSSKTGRDGEFDDSRNDLLFMYKNISYIELLYKHIGRPKSFFRFVRK